MKPEKQNDSASTHPEAKDTKKSQPDESVNDEEKRLLTAKPEIGTAAAQTLGAGAVGGKTPDIVSEEEIRALVVVLEAARKTADQRPQLEGVLK